MTKKKSKLQPESAEPKIETEAAIEAEVETAEVIDPIGDTTDGEAKNTVEAGTESEIETEDSTETEGASDPEFNPKPRPPAKLERLQKILAAAGVASRRSAEAMIEQGRVQINGKVVTVLGTKADAGRDHIRVDGKLLQGAERHRYFVLNKPRGFVTTVKDPEGRPTVMQFFDKMKERLYPVGRLDYLSEGLLVVTAHQGLFRRGKNLPGQSRWPTHRRRAEHIARRRRHRAWQTGLGSGAHFPGPHPPGSPGRQSLV